MSKADRLRKYSPDQERDDHGRFGSGGSSEESNRAGMSAKANTASKDACSQERSAAKAVADCAAAIRLMPESAWGYSTLALALGRQARHEEAAAAASKALQIAPDDAESFAIRGRAMVARGGSRGWSLLGHARGRHDRAGKGLAGGGGVKNLV